MASIVPSTVIRFLRDSIGTSGWGRPRLVPTMTRSIIRRSGEAGTILAEVHWRTSAVTVFKVTQGPVDSTGCLIVGSEGTLSAGLWNTDCHVRRKGDTAFRGADQGEVEKIAKTQPRIDTEVLKWDPRRAAKGQRPRWSMVNNSHMFEWVLACAGDAKSYFHAPKAVIPPCGRTSVNCASRIPQRGEGP